MLTQPKHKADKIGKADRFKALARELGCDEDEAAFKAALGHIARQKPKDESVGDVGGTPRKKSG